MTLEIRPIVKPEAIDFMRAVPGNAGLPNWEPDDAAGAACAFAL